MKKLGAILFGIVFILGLSIVTAPAQQVDILPDGVLATGDWDPTPVVSDLNDLDAADPDASYTTAYDWYSYLTVDFKNPTGGPFTAIKVKLRARSTYGDSDKLSVGIYVRGQQIGYDQDEILNGSFQEYPFEWPGLNMDATDVADLQVKIEVTDFYDGGVDVSAVQVELVSEVVAPPEEPDPIHVKIDYRPYRKSNPLNYRSRYKARVVIFGSAEFDVRQIDRESLRLAGVAPVRDYVRRVYSCTDRARDDYPDLILKFKNQQLIKALEISREQELENGDEVVLNLTGNLKDDGNLEDDGAIPIEGEDTAVVYGKRHKHKKKGKWKNHWKWWR